ncbi:MAG: response regulator [Actinobacteria bacterium]|nr:response regulator [Actinomycetota bacterium]
MAKQRNNHRVLYIEDDPWISDILRLALSKEGYEVIEAPSGTRGMEMVYEFLPHAILLDINMPIMNGFSVLESLVSYSALRERPVICVTAMTERVYTEKALEYGASGYVFKPVNFQILCKLLDFYTSEDDMDSRISRLLEEPLFAEAYEAAGRSLNSFLKLDLMRTLAFAGQKGATLEELMDQMRERDGVLEKAVSELIESGLLESSGGSIKLSRDQALKDRVSKIQTIARDDDMRVAFVNLIFLGLLED